MTTMKADIIYSPVPHQDRFITVGNDLHLYQIEEIVAESQKALEGIKISEKTVAVSLAINNEHPYMKCMAWYPKPEPENLLAIGQANGKIILTSFGHVEDSQHLIGREFIPRSPHHCNCIAWNPEESNLLASGFDKGRSNPSLLIWDVMKPPCVSTSGRSSSEKRHMVGNKPAHETHSSGTALPLVELGVSETVHSLHWFSHQPKLLVCGMNNKHLKIFDLRDTIKPHNTTPTKAVYGVCVDPFYEHRLASFMENQVVLWDMRNFEKPVINLHEPRQVTKIAWCPTRAGLLASLTRESSVVHLYDFQQASIGNEELEPTVIERSIQPCGGDFVSSFAWHSTHENRLLAITQMEVIHDYTVFDRITLNWSPASEIVWTYGRRVLHSIDHRDKLYKSLQDISVVMRKRAFAGYGLKSEQLWQNGKIAEDDSMLQNLWTWLDLVKSLSEDGTLNVTKESTFIGVQTLLQEALEGKGQTWGKTMEPILLPWADLDSEGVTISSKTPVYQNEDRRKALQLCGWGGFPGIDVANLDAFLDRLESDGQLTRAAAIALFNLKIRRAIDILSKAEADKFDSADGSLSVVAMALSGYSDERNTLWQKKCMNLRQQLRSSYLRAMFSFLTCANGDYKEILNDQNISVQDRVAFACIFLPDEKLLKFLDEITAQMIETGNLNGFLLTGLNSDGLNLLQRYLDATGDVQTVSLVVLQGLPSEICQDQRALNWVENYRELLDTWRMWHQRALFDVEWHKRSQAEKPQQQIYISCNFCGKSVSSHLQTIGLVSGPRDYGRFSAANKFKPQDQLSSSDVHSQPRSRKQSFVMNKVTSCPSCRKPLPRCSLCLNNMGTSAGAYWNRPGVDKNAIQMKEEKLTKFSSWFTWCQTCRHGGHAMHLIDWFREHTECPVTGCNCKCMSMDAIARRGTAAVESN